MDPDGPVEYKEVQEVFVRVAPIVNLHVASGIIETTAEHPFYVPARGWVPAWALQIGDLLSTRDASLVPVEGVGAKGAVETVTIGGLRIIIPTLLAAMSPILGLGT